MEFLDSSYFWTGPVALVLYTAGFCIATYLTRAPRARITAALVAGGATAFAQLGADSAAHALGLYRYPFVTTPYAPLAFYLVTIPGAGMLALVVWRVDRRWSTPGVLWFAVVLAAYYAIHDYVTSVVSNLIEFRPGIAGEAGDAVIAFVLALVIFGVMRLAGGPSAADGLRGGPGPARGELEPLAHGAAL